MLQTQVAQVEIRKLEGKTNHVDQVNHPDGQMSQPRVMDALVRCEDECSSEESAQSFSSEASRPRPTRSLKIYGPFRDLPDRCSKIFPRRSLMRSVQHNSRSRYLCGLGILVSWVLFASLPSVSLGAGAPAKTGATPASSQPDSAARALAVASYGKLPLSFEANQGQTNAHVKFLSRGNPNTPQVVTLTNSGDVPLSITSIGITGTNSGDFNQWNNCPTSPSTLASGDHCTITVMFAPTETGTLNADVTISDNAPDSPQMVPVTGIGVGGKIRPE